MDDARRALDLATDLLEYEGQLLDERRWDDWLDLYASQCTYWVPMWSDETTLNDDTDTQLSYIYYENRKGLEDRVARIRSRKSPASTPPPRTAHLLSGVRVLEHDADRIVARATWACHVLFTRSREQHAFFGHAEYGLSRLEGKWKIQRKKVALFNDDIPTVLDVYCL